MDETVRLHTQQIEQLALCKYACPSAASRGRMRPEPECPLRTCFQRDRDRIVHCKSFRRLKQKTQVFLSPEGDHYRTRLTHTLEVAQIARTIARALRLNEDLTEAIALGHDLGHTPFGHAGERALDALCPGGFKHYLQSVRVVQRLEKQFQGLNLTWDVLNGIACHTRGRWPATREGCVVRYADRIAYMNHDIEDAVTAGVLHPSALPPRVVQVLGGTKSRRIYTLIADMVAHGPETIGFSPAIEEQYNALHSFMYATVYVDPVAKREEQKVEKVMEELFGWFCADASRLPADYQRIAEKEGVPRAVTDYISGMSDAFAIRTFERLFVPQKWQGI